MLATGDRFNTANAWDAKTGVYLKTFWGHTDQIHKIAFSLSEDGVRLATASGDGKAKIGDTKSGRLLLSLSGHSLPIDDLAFSPDDKYLASAGWDGRVNIWEIPSGTLVASVCSTKGRKFLDVNFNPDGEDLVMAMGTPNILVVHGWKRYLKEPLENESAGQDTCKIVATSLPGTASNCQQGSIHT